MAEETPHTWTCPSCGRRVPQRAEACHCGMTRARAEEVAAASPAEAPRRPARSRLPVSRREVLATMPGDVKALVVAGAIVLAAGLGWLVFAPQPAELDPGHTRPRRPGPPSRPEADAPAHAPVQAPLVEVSQARTARISRP